MKLILSSFLAAVALAVGIMSFAGQASAQTGPCQTNPSPVDAADPSIIVSTPSDGDEVTSPIAVAGQARVFEAVVSLALYDADGNELLSQTAMAAEGQVLSDFETTIDFATPEEREVCLWVFESSAQDGSPVNVVQIPLTLLPEEEGPSLPDTGAGSSDRGTMRFSAWLLIGGAAALAIGGTSLAAARRRG